MNRLAITSDSHDQVAHMQAAVHHCNESGIEVIAHCGELISPFMLKQLAAFLGHVHLIYGNNVGDQHLISTRCEREYGNITHHGILGTFACNGYKVWYSSLPRTCKGTCQPVNL